MKRVKEVKLLPPPPSISWAPLLEKAWRAVSLPSPSSLHPTVAPATLWTSFYSWQWLQRRCESGEVPQPSVPSADGLLNPAHCISYREENNLAIMRFSQLSEDSIWNGEFQLPFPFFLNFSHIYTMFLLLEEEPEVMERRNKSRTF